MADGALFRPDRSRWPHPQRIPIIYNMYKQKTQHTNCRRAEVGFSNYLYRFIYFISYNSVLCTRCAVFTIIQTFTPTVQSDCMATGTKCIQRTRHQQTRDPNGIWDASVTVIIIIIIILIIIIVLRFVYWLPCRSLCSSSHVMGSGRRMHWNEHFQLGGGGGETIPRARNRQLKLLDFIEQKCKNITSGIVHRVNLFEYPWHRCISY